MADKVQADFHKCGAGRGSECCAYLVGGSGGAECGREIPGIRATTERRVRNGEMSARRLPIEAWPECMTFPAQATEAAE